jgi:NAD+ synthase (glutamine-hydrolysing)
MTENNRSSFFNLHTHGFVRVATGTPALRVADPAFNVDRAIEMLRTASAKKSSLLLFPELALSGYAIDDLLQQSALLDAVEAAVAELCNASRELGPIVFIGAPVRAGGRLYNAALAIHRGRLLCCVSQDLSAELSRVL